MYAPTIDREMYVSVVQAAIEKHGNGRDALIPILSEINHVLGMSPAEAIHEVRNSFTIRS
jgi:NADH:ubiquinone oxidoreductase subunit E